MTLKHCLDGYEFHSKKLGEGKSNLLNERLMEIILFQKLFINRWIRYRKTCHTSNDWTKSGRENC